MFSKLTDYSAKKVDVHVDKTPQWQASYDHPCRSYIFQKLKCCNGVAATKHPIQPPSQ
jgi:hypothetical protein